MDFGTLLHVAKKNSENTKNGGKYYNTKYSPPKKESKEKKLSANIQKFLQKREEEEKQRQLDEKRKLNNLLSMRDDKSKNKIKKMLKVTKSANKSVLDDMLDAEHRTAPMAPDTSEGPEQLDQDDYGYVSTEANALYHKYIEKVKNVKEEKGFAPSRPQSLKDLSGTKERVKAAITKEIEDKSSHTRQRSSIASSTTTATTTPSASTGPAVGRAYSTSKPIYDPDAERRDEERKKRDEEQKKIKQRRAAPPPMDFQALLKLAEKKQHEPIAVVQDVKKNKEPERLLTLKEKREMEERKRAQEARERRKREMNEAPAKERRESGGSVVRVKPNGRIPKLNQAAKTSTAPKPLTTSQPTATKLSTGNKTSASSWLSKNGPVKESDLKKSNTSGVSTPSHSSKTSSTTVSKLKTSNVSHASHTPNATTSSVASSSATKSSKLPVPSKAAALNSNSKNLHAGAGGGSGSGTMSSKKPYNGPTREYPPRDIKTIKPRQFPPPDVQKTRQFPPADVRRGPPTGRPGDNRKPAAPKRRIIDDDEDEYDSDLDDFIDDGDDEEDYSSHIKAIFGYDKSRYRNIDDHDDTAMESNFAQVQREEYISKKIGLQEDLEDMKLEAIEKKRKMINKKRKIQD